jgi:hypothetical protein
MALLNSLRMAGLAYGVLSAISFMVAGLIRCMTMFLKAEKTNG